MVTTTFAMDTAFYSPIGSYPLRTRCEMTAELGYGATYLTLWNERSWQELERLQHEADAAGIGVVAVHLDLDLEGNGPVDRLLAALPSIPATTVIEVAVPPPAEPLEPREAATLLFDQLARLHAARPAGAAPISLYPHVDHWLETHEQAAWLLAEAPVDLGLHTNVNGFHWYATDRRSPTQVLPDLARSTSLVNLCGSRRTADGKYTLEPLDSGMLDNAALLGLLRGAGFAGPVGIQGYSVAGDAYEHLRRSLAALQSIERRITEHPEWSELDWDLRR